MNTILSPLEFLLTNIICFIVGAIAVVVLRLVGRVAYRAGQRHAECEIAS